MIKWDYYLLDLLRLFLQWLYFIEMNIQKEIFLDRFINLVLLCVLSIILLIISPNLIRLLLGWDGLGLVSYLLVIYYQSRKSYNAGIITALRNRLGDVALLFRIAWIVNCRDWNYIYYLNNFSSLNINVISRVLIAFEAITKSAQIPFSAWLPEAIAAPTPVSSLVHSSTLVTAGVYLLIRLYRSLQYNSREKFTMIVMMKLHRVINYKVHFRPHVRCKIRYQTFFHLKITHLSN